MYHREEWAIVPCNISCFITTCMLFTIEVTQMSDSGIRSYFKSTWNWNDFTMYIIYWFYCYLRLFSNEYSRNYLLVKDIEFEDSHLETHVVIDMLKNERNQTVMQDEWDNYLKSNAQKDY